MSANQEQLQMFGGDWTEKKLGVLEKYLTAYTTALKNQPFKKVYMDAFAGTGYRELKSVEHPAKPLFEEIAQDAPKNSSTVPPGSRCVPSLVLTNIYSLKKTKKERENWKGSGKRRISSR
jgi:hypothetical protein